MLLPQSRGATRQPRRPDGVGRRWTRRVDPAISEPPRRRAIGSLPRRATSCWTPTDWSPPGHRIFTLRRGPAAHSAAANAQVWTDRRARPTMGGMSKPIDILGLYLHLARTHQQQRSLFDRDRLLVLASVFAAQMELPDVSACCRQRILDHNVGHLIGKWPTVEEAMGHEDFKYFVGRVYRRFPQNAPNGCSWIKASNWPRNANRTTATRNTPWRCWARVEAGISAVASVFAGRRPRQIIARLASLRLRWHIAG